MLTPPMRLVATTLLILPLIATFGCSTRLDPTKPVSQRGSTDSSAPLRAVESPDGPGGGSPGFYPLQQGNHWDYAREFSVEVRPTSGPPSRFVFTSTIASDQTCVETVAGRAYLIERAVESGEGGPFLSWIRLRQDRSGLYEADIAGRPACEGVALSSSMRSVDSGDDPDASLRALAGKMPAGQQAAWLAALQRDRDRRLEVRAALGLATSTARRAVSPPPGELLRLSYPLRTGAEWILRPDPDFTERVEGVDALHTPAGTLEGYRIRIRSSLFGEADQVFLWYGRKGFLQLEGHFEGLAVDDQGNVYGTVVSEERQALTGLSLVDAPSEHLAP